MIDVIKLALSQCLNDVLAEAIKRIAGVETTIISMAKRLVNWYDSSLKSDIFKVLFISTIFAEFQKSLMIWYYFSFKLKQIKKF